MLHVQQGRVDIIRNGYTFCQRHLTLRHSRGLVTYKGYVGYVKAIHRLFNRLWHILSIGGLWPYLDGPLASFSLSSDDQNNW